MKAKKVPLRRCVGCMKSKPKKELTRIVSTKEGLVQIDETGKMPGRGAYICKDPKCCEIAMKKRGIARSLGVNITAEQLEEIQRNLEVIHERESI